MKLPEVDIARVRRRAMRHGFAVRKSRERRVHARDQGGLRVSDGRTGIPLAGQDWELDIDGADAALTALIEDGKGWAC